ncbi:hypothetical protein [Carboxylicivirga taeanensis]|uniref:hypothetical protein n=1 Tax=Carboxylicivirga taeanensis TaxID=1416875 RepID=UPI003F6DF5F9
MEKEALIDIILNDIKEVHALVNTFKGKHELNSAFINLTRTKIANISEELSLLEQLNAEKKVQPSPESLLTSAPKTSSSNDDSEAYAESSSRFAQGESHGAEAPTQAVDELKNHASTTSNALKTATEANTNAFDTGASKQEAEKTDSETVPPTGLAKAADILTKPGASHTTPDDGETLKSDSKTMPPAEPAKATDILTKPSASDTTPSDRETLKSDGETKPPAEPAKATDILTKPSASDTTPSDRETLKSDGETKPPAEPAITADTHTQASVSHTLPGEDKTFELHIETAAQEVVSRTEKPDTDGAYIKKEIKPTKAAILGEVMRKEGSSVNEAIASRKEQTQDIKQIGKPVKDVRQAFGLNDRFYYQRELFSNNADLFNQTLDQINHMETYGSAISFLQSNYSWEANEEAAESFYKSIKRRFI